MKKFLAYTPFCMLFMACSFMGNTQSNFWKNITIRKAFETKTNDDNKPATLSFTIPKDTSTSYLINAGIGYKFFNSNQNDVVNTLTAFFLYNRNTLVDKKTKNYKLGITEGFLKLFNDRPTTALFGTTSIEYLRNYIDTTHSLITTSYWHPIYKSPNFIPIGGYMNAEHIVDYFFVPQVGLEYQKILDANTKNKEGYDARFYFNSTLNVKFKKKTMKTIEEIKQDKMDSLNLLDEWKDKKYKEVKDYVDRQVPRGTREPRPKDQWHSLLLFSFSYTGRSSFANHNSNFEKYMPLFTASVNLYPFDTEDFSIGASYNDGANPIDGTPKQTFWLLSVNFKK